MPAKFIIGDNVRFAPRACKGLTANLRKRTRKIADIYYDADQQCCFYQLGGNGGLHKAFGMWFRSYELYPVNGQAHKIGRPKGKLVSKVRMESPEQKASRFGNGVIVGHSQITKTLLTASTNPHINS